MSWVKITNERYENSDTNQYTSYMAASETHLDFWYLHNGTTDKTIDGKSTPQEFGIPEDVIASDPQEETIAEDTEIVNDDTDDNTPGIGHNSEIPTSIAADRLCSIIDRIERLEEEKKAMGSDIKDIFGEAKSAGFDTKVIRALLRLRRQDPSEVEEQETLLDVYRRALGM